MKIEKAIEILDRYLTHPYIKGEHELQDAASLGIEALKAITVYRERTITKPLFHLSGETKEN